MFFNPRPPNKKKHILHVLTPSKLSGAELYALLIVLKLKKYFRFTIITEPIKEVIEKARDWKLPIQSLGIEGKGNLSGFFRLRKAVSTLSPDLIHVHHTTGSFFSSVIGHEKKIPVICTLHGFVPFFWQRFCSSFITISRAVDEYYESSIPNLSRRTYIPNGISLQNFRPPSQRARREIRRRMGIQDNEFVITQVSHLSPKKRPDLILRALEEIRLSTKVHVFILGDGPQRSMLLKEIKNLPPNVRVHVLGFSKDVRSHLQAADLFALFPRREPLGFAFLEAMACGVPVLSVRTGSLIELVEDGTCGVLVDNPSPKEVGTVLKNLAEKRGLLKSLGKNARRQAENYSLEVFLRRMKNYYESSFVGAGQGPGPRERG